MSATLDINTQVANAAISFAARRQAAENEAAGYRAEAARWPTNGTYDERNAHIRQTILADQCLLQARIWAAHEVQAKQGFLLRVSTAPGGACAERLFPELFQQADAVSRVRYAKTDEAAKMAWQYNPPANCLA